MCGYRGNHRLRHGFNETHLSVAIGSINASIVLVEDDGNLLNIVLAFFYAQLHTIAILTAIGVSTGKRVVASSHRYGDIDILGKAQIGPVIIVIIFCHPLARSECGQQEE